uniref:DNA helicase n=1 Tax=Hyaloperonospora arabidopsidis (strain Emoy2) TaxID=559515 RepID=M4BCJ9_HYAAE
MTRRLLELEQNEEIQTRQNELQMLNDKDNPNVLTHITLARCSTGLFGRSVLQFRLPSLSIRHTKPHHFKVGDVVQLRGQKKSTQTGLLWPTGIVSRVEDQSLCVAIQPSDLSNSPEDDEWDDLGTTFTLDRLVNNATFEKLLRVLRQMEKHDVAAAQAAIDVIFANREPQWHTPLPALIPFHLGLNESQVEAIRFALASKDVALIHGPPGTGKTTTVVELILQAVTAFNLKVLVCAPSNIAVDNVLEKLAKTCLTVHKQLRLTRVGHPARMLPHIVKYCLDAKIQQAEGTEIVKDIRKEMGDMQTKLHKTRDKSVRFQLRREMKANRKEICVREKKVVGEVVRQSDVVFATNVGAASTLLKDVTFDLVIIDEAAQALEVSCWIPILKARRCVLAGDHLQLPPTIKSKTAAAKGLEVTLFDRITHFTHTQSIVKMLNIQYRMHEHISEWSSQAMYKGELKSFDGVAKRKLHELPHVNISEEDELLDATLLLLDTAGCDLEEDVDEDHDEGQEVLRLSKSNKGEALIVARHVQALLEAGLKEDEVAVITPYNKQVQALKALLLEKHPKLEVRSVDGFQGCEKEAVVMSLVRSNAFKQVGFLADDRRINVAITRAKRHVAVVCDTDTITSHKFLAVLVQHFENLGEYRSAQEYLEMDVVQGVLDEQLMLSQSASTCESESRSGHGALLQVNGAAKTNVVKAAKLKKTVTHKKGVEADPLLLVKSDTVEQTEDEAQILDTKPNASDVVDDVVEKSEGETEDESVVTKSVFQMMSSDSDSSDDERKSDGLKEDVDDCKLSNPHAGMDLKTANSLLKDLHLNRLTRQPVPPPAPCAKRKKKKWGAAKAATNATIEELKDGEDELDFLTRQASKSQSCAFELSSRCKKSIVMFGSVCKFCNLKFCYDHVQPEVHGCGDAVRKFERVEFQRPTTSNNRKNTLTIDKRKVLQKKLNEKMSAKTASRATQSKSKKK